MKNLTENEHMLLACLDQFKGKIDWHPVAAELNITFHAVRQRVAALRKTRDAMLGSDTTPSTSPEKATEENAEPVTPTKKVTKGVLSASPKATRVTKRGRPKKAAKQDGMSESEE